MHLTHHLSPWTCPLSLSFFKIARTLTQCFAVVQSRILMPSPLFNSSLSSLPNQLKTRRCQWLLHLQQIVLFSLFIFPGVCNRNCCLRHHLNERKFWLKRSRLWQWFSRLWPPFVLSPRIKKDSPKCAWPSGIGFIAGFEQFPSSKIYSGTHTLQARVVACGLGCGSPFSFQNFPYIV